MNINEIKISLSSVQQGNSGGGYISIAWKHGVIKKKTSVVCLKLITAVEGWGNEKISE